MGVLRDLVDTSHTEGPAAEQLRPPVTETGLHLAPDPDATHVPARTLLRAFEAAQPLAPMDDTLSPQSMWRGVAQRVAMQEADPAAAALSAIGASWSSLDFVERCRAVALCIRYGRPGFPAAGQDLVSLFFTEVHSEAAGRRGARDWTYYSSVADVLHAGVAGDVWRLAPTEVLWCLKRLHENTRPQQLGPTAMAKVIEACGRIAAYLQSQTVSHPFPKPSFTRLLMSQLNPSPRSELPPWAQWRRGGAAERVDVDFVGNLCAQLVKGHAAALDFGHLQEGSRVPVARALRFCPGKSTADSFASLLRGADDTDEAADAAVAAAVAKSLSAANVRSRKLDARAEELLASGAQSPRMAIDLIRLGGRCISTEAAVTQAQPFVVDWALSDDIVEIGAPLAAELRRLRSTARAPVEELQRALNDTVVRVGASGIVGPWMAFAALPSTPAGTSALSLQQAEAVARRISPYDRDTQLALLVATRHAWAGESLSPAAAFADQTAEAFALSLRRTSDTLTVWQRRQIAALLREMST